MTLVGFLVFLFGLSEWCVLIFYCVSVAKDNVEGSPAGVGVAG